MNPEMELSVNPRVIRLETYHVLVQRHFDLLSTVFDQLTLRPQRELLSKSDHYLQRRIAQMERIRTALYTRLACDAPGEQCTLTQLLNYATIASYQYNVILEAKRRNCSHYFDWATQYRLLVDRLPCKLVAIPPIGHYYDFMCYWLQPSEYLTMYRFFYYYIINYEATFQLPNSPH